MGSAYTSVSFIKTFHTSIAAKEKWLIIGFILISLLIFIFVGNPVKVLVMVGLLNGFSLPIALSIMLWAAYTRDTRKVYRHPVWLAVFGILVALATGAMGIYAIL